MRAFELYEESFGTNPESFSDGKVHYLSSKKAYVLVSPVESNLYVVVMIYADGRCLMSTTENKNVFSVIQGATKQLLKKDAVHKAHDHTDVISEMIRTIVTKFYNRIDQLHFIAVDDSDAKRLQRFVKIPPLSNFLRTRNYDYQGTEKIDGYILVTFSKEKKQQS